MASVHERKGSRFWWVSWRDALGNPHHKSTKIEVVPRGVKNPGERRSGMALNKKRAEDLGAKWERDDKGDAIPVQDQKVTAEIAERKLPGQKLGELPSRKAYFVNYLDTKIEDLNGSTPKLYLNHLEAWLAYEGPRSELPITTLTHEELSDFLKNQKDLGLAESTQYGRWSFIYYALKPVVGRHFKENPAAGLAPRKAYSSRRPLEPEELPKLLTAALAYRNGRQWVTAILFALYLGMRLSDAIRIRWSMMNWHEAYVDFTQFKLRRFKKELRTPLHDDLYRLLLHIHKTAPSCDEITPDLIGRCGSSLSASFQTIITKAKIDPGVEELMSGLRAHRLVFHSLRHTIVTWLDDLGVPESHRMELVGHASKKSHSPYSHTRLKGLRRTVAKLPPVPPGVIPLAEVNRPLPTSTGLLSDVVQKKFASIRELLQGGTLERRTIATALDDLQGSVVQSLCCEA